jgi:ribonuclease BN (tRNA processing enzyme)
VEADGISGDGRPRTYRVLLDLGSGALGPLQRHLAVADVDAVCLSHLHADHCLDLCGLYVALKYHPDLAGRRRVPVFGPHGTAGRLARAYDLPEDPGMSAELDVHEWSAGEPVVFGPLSVTPFRVEHPVEAYALRVTGPSETGERAVTVTYSGDTDACEGLVGAAAGADVLLCEAAFHEGRDTVRGIHLTGLRAGETARDAGVGRLVLTHLPPWNDPQRSLAEASKVWSGPLDLAEPGMVLEL